MPRPRHGGVGNHGRHRQPGDLRRSADGSHFRWACNKRFRNAIDTFADNSRHASPWAASVYANAIARGHDHPHAIRILGRAWVRVIYRCWTNHTPYDPALHGAAQRLQDPAVAA